MTLFQLTKHELRAIFSNPVILLTVFGGVIFYSFLYPLPYSQQIPREQTVSVVNLDKSVVSFQLERMVDATPQIKVVTRANSIEQAKSQFIAGEVSGLLVIPEHFYRDLLLGKSPTLAFAGDASYFLVYGTVVEGLATTSGTLAAKVKISRLLTEGEPISTAKYHHASSFINMKPTFNPQMGYINYVVPAVFVLILQQTLVMGVGLVGGTQKHGRGYWLKSSTLHRVAVRASLFVAIYYVLSMYYFGFSFDYYDVHRLANPLHLLAVLAPFLFTSAFVGIVLGAILPRRELVTLVVLISSMPLIFSAGFIWPLESIPTPIIWISNLFPSTPAIQSFLMLNQIGASFEQIHAQWATLWCQFVVWGALAYFAERK